jgi:hypothetical protein
LPSTYQIVAAVDTSGLQCGCCIVHGHKTARKRARDGQCRPAACPVHAPAQGAEPEIGTLQTLEALAAVNCGTGRIVLQFPVWSELAGLGKRQGRDKKKKFIKGRDLKVDIMVERYHGALRGSDADDVVAIEVHGPGHHTKAAQDQDGKKVDKTPFHVHPVWVDKMEDDSDYLGEAQKALGYAWGL